MKRVVYLCMLGMVLVACGKEGDESGRQVGACGKVRVAAMNWPSAQLLAHVDRLILEKGYGCDVELVPGDTMPTLTSMMEKGQPDVVPEAWINAVREALDTAVQTGRLHYASRVLRDAGQQGWWIPKYVADAHPEIRTIDDALRHPELFPAPGGRSKGAVFNCPPGWDCQLAGINAFKAWDAAAKGFVLVDTGSAAGLDTSIVRAFERKQGWLGYYWAPSAMLSRHDMVRLDAGVPHDRLAWDRCNSRAECAHPLRNDWPRPEVYTMVTDGFRYRARDAMRYLDQRGWSQATLSPLLAWMNQNQATGAEAAVYFLRTQPQVWKTWVPEAVAARVEEGL